MKNIKVQARKEGQNESIVVEKTHGMGPTGWGNKNVTTAYEREDEQDSKNAEGARRESGKRVSLESYLATREQGDPSKCQSVLCLEEGEYSCGQPAEHRGAHGARGQAVSFGGAVCDFKLLWDETVETAR